MTTTFAGDRWSAAPGAAVPLDRIAPQLQFLEDQSACHIVQFYEDDEFLARMVARFIGSGLLAGQPAIVIATAEHVHDVRAALTAASFDVERACRAGQLVLLDASRTLATFMVDGNPDSDLFQQQVGAVLARLTALKGGDCTIRAYGEMVDLLWRAGNGAAALRLEEMWNELSLRQSLSLLCAYRLSGFGKHEHSSAFEGICRAHGGVLPTERYCELQTESERLTRVGLLEQRSKTLEQELERRTALEDELRSALSAARMAQEDLRDFIDNGLEGIHWVGPDGTILFANQAELELLGYSHDEYVGRHIREFHVDAAVIEDILERLCRGESVVDREARLRCKDGAIKHVLIHSNVYWREGKFVHTRCFTRDVSERKKAELALLEQSRINANLARIACALSSELRLDQLVQKVTDEATSLCRAEFGAFFHHARNGNNGETYELYTLSGVVAREALASLPIPRNTDLAKSTFEGPGVVRLDDVTEDARYGRNPPLFGMPEGQVRVRSYLAVPVKSRSGEVLGGLFFGHTEPGRFTEADERMLVAVAAQAAIALDNATLIEGLEQAQSAAQREREKLVVIAEELERANRAKDEFLATVSHELRTPLNAMLGWTRMLRAGGLDADKRERALATIERNANTQTQLIEDLLDVSRIISGKLRLDVSSVDLPGVVENAVEVVRPAAEAKGVTIHQVLDQSAGPILGDAERLQQVLWNLLTNAVKFTQKGGAVEVALRRRDSSVEISVADNGVGIAPDFVANVFERFRQADASSARKQGGLGLGLAIVRSLVEIHGGSATCESAGLGKGATFTVRLPISPLRSSSLERPPALRLVTKTSRFERVQELGGAYLLIVDDEPDARELLAEMLSACDAKVEVAAAVAEAIPRIQECRPDIVISDIGMPGEDGYALIRQLRALPPERGGRTPAVALTAYTRFEDRTKALTAGFNMHVPKPVEPAELLAVLSSLVTTFGSRRSQPLVDATY